MVVAFEHQWAERCARTLSGGSHWDSSHRLDTTSNHNIICAAEHALRCEVNSLLARSTLTINRRTRNRFGKSCGKSSITSHIEALLSYLRSEERRVGKECR